jgi:hypothetical protein
MVEPTMISTNTETISRVIQGLRPMNGSNEMDAGVALIEALAAERDSLQAELDFAKAIFNDIASGRGMFGISAEQDLAWVMFYAKKTYEAFYTDPEQNKVE